MTLGRGHVRATLLHLLLGLLPAGLTPALALWPSGAKAEEAITEVVVTARKREESLQEVPLSISAFSAEALQDRNIQSVYDVAAFTPNFSFNPNTVGRRLDAPSLRGQFTPLQNYGSEGNVAFYVDGVFVSGTAGGLTTGNVERIEVLRGPQAAVFGRGAFAGAVNYITRQPTEDWEGQVNLKAGEDSDYLTAGWISGPLIGDKLLYFGSASWESYGGEWQNSMNPCRTGESPATTNCVALNPQYKTFWPNGGPPSTVMDDFTDLGGTSSWNITGTLQWNATEALTVKFKAEYTQTSDDHYADLLFPTLNCFPGPATPAGATVNPDSPGWYCGELKPDGLRSIMNIADLREGAGPSTFIPLDPALGDGVAAPAPFIGQETETRRYLLEAFYDLAGGQLIARATMNKQDLESYRDLDRSPYLGPLYANLFSSGERQSWDDQSYEFRAISPQDQAIRGTAGIYYFTADNIGFQREYTGFCNRVAYGLPYINNAPSWSLKAEKENLGFFGGLDYDATDQVTISVEGRYAKDSPTQMAANGVTAKANYYSFTPRATVTWQPTDDVNLYALVAKGNKPGGFFYGYFDAPVLRTETERSLRSEDGRAPRGVIKEEEAWTYEVGAKTQWADGRVTANVSVYYIDWKNQAFNEIDNIAWFCEDTGYEAEVANSFIVNAGASTVVGGEVELAWAATENLFLTLNYGLADTDLEEFESTTLFDLTGNPDASGAEAPRVPKNNLTASATYTRPLGDRGADWFLRGDYIYNSKTYIDVENLAYLGDLNLFNARLGVETEAWTAAVYVNNITNEDTPLLGSEFPNFNVFPANIKSAFHLVPRRSRNAGISLQYNF